MIISVIRTVFLYVFVIIAVRLMGKRQISDMQPSELVVTFMISNIASLPMQNTSQPLLSGFIPVIMLVSLELITSFVMMKSGKFRKLICGNPVVIISDGKLLQNQMRRLRLTTEDLYLQLRQQNVFSINEVQYCIMETNGTLSVLEKPEFRVPNAKEQGVTIPDNKMETAVISDGVILESSLKLCRRSADEVRAILKSENKLAKEVFLMTMDGTGSYTIIDKEKCS